MSSQPPLATGSSVIDVLLVDDDATVRAVLCAALRSAGYTLRCAGDGREALQLAATMRFRLVVTDIYMPEMDGLELVSSLHTRYPDLPTLAMSGGGRAGGPADVLRPARLLGSHRTIEKPFDLDTFLGNVRDLLTKSDPPPGPA
jgi:CheY-like chemotaxis protein